MMKKFKMLCLMLLIVCLCGVCVPCVSEASSSKMVIKSYERISKKTTRVYFKPVKGAKQYKVEYYWQKSDRRSDISNAYCKLINPKKAKKKKGLIYVDIKAKSPIQYASVSYKTKSKGAWKKWSGYKKVKCKHPKQKTITSNVHHDAVYEKKLFTDSIVHPAVMGTFYDFTYTCGDLLEVSFWESKYAHRNDNGSYSCTFVYKMTKVPEEKHDEMWGTFVDECVKHMNEYHTNGGIDEGVRENDRYVKNMMDIFSTTRKYEDVAEPEYIEYKSEYRMVKTSEAYDETVKQHKCKWCGEIVD